MTDDGEESVGDAGFDEFVAALAEGDGYYVECANGHGSLPPRRVCPECGSADLDETALPETGEVATYTKVHVPAPSFADDAPYVTAVVDFGPVRLTGQVLAAVENVEIGTTVEVGVRVTETRGDPLVVFEPR
ncbi:Zn-ribbon domain-containing OB-fold protein [Halobacterium sp. CBA1132]|uniref:Zn-ribbon domain-containing OB-fold protein n=1 Tax=Halobacterium sp. CBA1132 TaxID=1765057 RepID=UPI00073E67D2|nr:OB-fold domain-containing protein [Halobacterium sp. CBA1132]